MWVRWEWEWDSKRGRRIRVAKVASEHFVTESCRSHNNLQMAYNIMP